MFTESKGHLQKAPAPNPFSNESSLRFLSEIFGVEAHLRHSELASFAPVLFLLLTRLVRERSPVSGCFRRLLHFWVPPDERGSL